MQASDGLGHIGPSVGHIITDGDETVLGSEDIGHRTGSLTYLIPVSDYTLHHDGVTCKLPRTLNLPVLFRIS